jgi:alkylation response protein AidB-like acyl-CoA dehydrogenase
MSETLLDATTPPSADGLLDRAAALAPMLRRRAVEIEQARRLPADVLDALSSAGCFRVLHPATHGGAESDLPTALALYELLARADGSTAWTVMIGSVGWIDLTDLPRASFDALFDGPGDLVVAGAFAPSGSIVADGDHYRVEGRWGFVSGCEHASAIYGNCVEGVVDGVPQLRIAVFDPDEVEIEDTWHVAGLRGTGSHHVHIGGLRVPASRTLVPLSGRPCIDVAAAHLHVPAVVALAVASVALGIGRGALDDVLALSPSKVPLLASEALGASPGFQAAVARADVELRAARALLHSAAADAWAAAAARAPLTLEQRGEARATASWVVERAVAAVDAAHRAAGGGAIYVEHPLQRRLRDIQTLRQHFLVRPDTFEVAGGILNGLEPTIPIF